MKKTKNEELDFSSSQAVRDLGLLFLTQEQMDFLDKCVKVSYDGDGDKLGPGTWKFNEDGTVDVDGSFNCSRKRLTDFKGIRFGKVNGWFDCSKNKLTSLEGAPKYVTGAFLCDDNPLTSLKGIPHVYTKRHYGEYMIYDIPVVIKAPYHLREELKKELEKYR